MTPETNRETKEEIEETTMELTEQRRFVTPEPDEDWEGLARRSLPDEETGAAVEKLRSWNLHLFVRNPPGVLLGSDIVFTEPPRAEPGALFGG